MAKKKPHGERIPAWLENSREDREKDKRMARERGMSVAAFEGSPADEAADRRLMKRMRGARAARGGPHRKFRAP